MQKMAKIARKSLCMYLHFLTTQKLAKILQYCPANVSILIGANKQMPAVKTTVMAGTGNENMR